MIGLDLRADKSNLSDSISKLQALLNEKNLDEAKKNKLILSVEEVILNIIEHNNKRSEACIEIQLTIGEKITLIVRDNSANFDPTKGIKMEDNKNNFGLKIIKGVTSNFQYVPTIGYNRVILTF